MGVKLFAWIGGLALFLGVAFFVKYSFDHNWIPPEVRVAIGFLVGIALVVGGVPLSRQDYKVTAHTLCATGIVSLYGVAFACRSIYHFPFFGPGPTLLLMVLGTTTAFTLKPLPDPKHPTVGRWEIRRPLENVPVKELVVVCTFRRENKARLTASFVQVLQLAQQLKVLKFGQITVAADGTKTRADASKHSAVSHERAGTMIEQLQLEVAQLLTQAEQADATPLEDPLTIPEEITRREERRAALARARAEIEARAHARLAEHEQKLAGRAAKKKRGEKGSGQEP